MVKRAHLRSERLIKIVGLLFFITTFSSVMLGAQSSGVNGMYFTDSLFPPYVIGKEGESADGGIAVDIASEIFRRLDIPVRIELYPWSRVLKMLEAGSSDGALLLMWDEERSRYLGYTEKLLESSEYIYFDVQKNPDFTWKNYDDLAGYVIGLVRGFVYGDDFERAIREYGLRIEYAQTSEMNLRKLNAGRIDLVVEDKNVAEWILRSLGDDALSIVRDPLKVSSYTYYMALSREDRLMPMLEDINMIIREMNEAGTIDRIIDTYTK
jgi:polar amino acid transport system substrate-binding protein